MELQQALENIKSLKSEFAEKEILCIREHKEEAIPNLLKNVCELVENFNEIPDSFDDFDDHTYAMFLLAEFKVHEAFEPFIRILEFEEEKCEWLLCDLTHDMGQMIGSVADKNDIDRIKTVIENREVNEFQRSAALTALITMYADGKYGRDDFFVYLGHLLDKFEDDEDFITHIVYCCHNVHAVEYYERILKLYDKNIIDTFFVDAEAFNNVGTNENADTAFAELKANPHYQTINDTVECIRCWACFNEKPERKPKLKNEKNVKIGRNDPCPCGSGKKYKRCCLNN